MVKKKDSFICDLIEPDDSDKPSGKKETVQEAVYKARTELLHKRQILRELEELLLKQRKQVFNFLRSKCDEDTDPHDLLHDIILKTRDSYEKKVPKDRDEALARLHTIAFHSFVDDKRANKCRRRNLHLGRGQICEAMGWRHKSEAEMYRKRLEEKALNLCLTDFDIPGMKPKERQLLRLMFKNNLSVTQIADLSHTPVSTLSGRLRSAIGKIRRFLERDEACYEFFYPE